MGDNKYTKQAGSITVKLNKSIKMTLKLMTDHSKEDFIDLALIGRLVNK